MSSPLSPPRVCVLSKAGGREYGFHLHGEKGKHGQYVKSVDAGSPAEQSGLRPDDRVIEVNGVNIERETHQQVVDASLSQINPALTQVLTFVT